MMPKISLCMIAKDEERWIAKAIESVKPIISEIVVVDTGSKDRTKEIAAALGAKVFEYTWNDDFSAARNESLKHATGDWILILDADEAISEKDHEKMIDILRTTDADAITLIQRNYVYEGFRSNLTKNPGDYGPSKEFLWYFPQEVIRLFRNKKGYRYKNRVHELVEYSIREHKGKILCSNIPFHHLGYVKEEGIVDRKREAYLKIGKKELEDNPKDARAMFDMALVHKEKKEYDKAIKIIENVIEIDDTQRDPYLLLGELYSQKEEFSKAIRNLIISSEKHPENASSLVNLGHCYASINELEKAEQALVKAIDLKDTSAMAYRNLFAVLIRQKKYHTASKVLEKASEKTGIESFRRDLEKLKRIMAQ